MSGVGGSEIFRFSQYFLAIDLLHLPKMRNFLWEDSQTPEVMDDPADGCWLGARNAASDRERSKQRMKFLFTKVGVFSPETPDLLYHCFVPEAFSFDARSA